MTRIDRPSAKGYIGRFDAEQARLGRPSQVALVDSLIGYTRCESNGDWDGVLAMVDDSAVFRDTGHGITGVRTINKHELRRFYEAEEQLIPGFRKNLEMAFERFLVNGTTVAYDGRAYIRVSEDQARILGVNGLAAEHGDVLLSWRMAVFVEFESQRLTGRNTYLGRSRVELATHEPSRN